MYFGEANINNLLLDKQKIDWLVMIVITKGCGQHRGMPTTNTEESKLALSNNKQV